MFSIIIIVTTIIGFASMIIDTIDRTAITTSLQLIKDTDPTLSTFVASPQENFMFAVEVWHVDMTGP